MESRYPMTYNQFESIVKKKVKEGLGNWPEKDVNAFLKSEKKTIVDSFKENCEKYDGTWPGSDERDKKTAFGEGSISAIVYCLELMF